MTGFPDGLHGSAMHDHVLRALEVGERAARAEDDEACGFGPLLDTQLVERVRAHPERWEETVEPWWSDSLARALRRLDELDAEAAWLCWACGSSRWVGWRAGPERDGFPLRAQCVPCGRVQAPPCP